MCIPPVKLDCAATDTMLVSGKFQGTNLYYLNPELVCTDSTAGYSCILAVVNDSIVIPIDSCATYALEVPLKNNNLEIYDAVIINWYSLKEPGPGYLIRLSADV